MHDYDHQSYRSFLATSLVVDAVATVSTMINGNTVEATLISIVVVVAAAEAEEEWE